MPARFPDKTFYQRADVVASQAEKEQKEEIPPSCQLIVKKEGGRDIWALGSKFILKNRKYYPGSEIEAHNTNFAADLTPDDHRIPKIINFWREGDGFLCIQERIEGDSLENMLPTLTQEDLARIGKGLGEYLLKFRNTSAPRMEMRNQEPVIDRRLFQPLLDKPDKKYTVCTSNEDVKQNLAMAIEDRIDRGTLVALMAKMPSATPFTFTHSDLHEGNIMVKDGEFSGIVDWELAGYYPVWWEFVDLCEVISDHLPAEVKHEAALEWFRVYHAIRDGTDREEVARMVDAYLPAYQIVLPGQ
ncbi:hypothetical protein M426DRAFT_165124 [Hypoxylon sp. CI-4A]|nr:hypothetical protein M426DRAFT_165124 [Hypoxylon sp. CI-4A]